MTYSRKWMELEKKQLCDSLPSVIPYREEGRSCQNILKGSKASLLIYFLGLFKGVRAVVPTEYILL